MKSIYDMMYGKNTLNEAVNSAEVGYKNPEDTLVELTDNTHYYIFAGGTKPFHAGHNMLLTKIVNDAKNDNTPNSKSVVCFFVGLGNRKGSDAEIEIRGDQVKKIWEEVVIKRLIELAGDDLEVIVEYGGGPIIKARQIIQAINSGEINQSKAFVYSDPEDTNKNYIRKTTYVKDESQKSIAKKRLENPEYTGYTMGDEQKSSPRRDLANLRVASDPEHLGSDYDVYFKGLTEPDTTGERLSSGTAMRTAAKCGDINAFIAGLPQFVKDNPDLLKVYLDEFCPELNDLNEIKRAEKGTSGYSAYLEEIMNELQYVKSAYESRKKNGYRYRKEAGKIQDAYAELRRLKRKNERAMLNAAKVNEVINQKGYITNVKVDVSDDVAISTRDFFKKLR